MTNKNIQVGEVYIVQREQGTVSVYGDPKDIFDDIGEFLDPNDFDGPSHPTDRESFATKLEESGNIIYVAKYGYTKIYKAPVK